jgi:hypothetical protein
MRLQLLSIGLLAGSIFTSCGDDKTDPKPTTLDELQNAKGLSVSETGTGKVRLTWVGNNGEDNFTGYNIFGMKMSSDLENALDSANVGEGDSLQLTGQDGEPKEDAKAVLQLMSYNGKDLESAETAKPTDEDVKFQYYPIYTKKDVFPTCLPTEKTGLDKACTPLTAESDESTFYGTTNYDIEGLTPGAKYCFLVFSTLDGGKTVAMTSSELRCVTPTVHAKEVTVSVPHTSHLKIDMKALRTACTTTTCEIAFAEYTRTAPKTDCDNDAETTDLLCIESFGASGKPQMTGGQFVSINDLGYYGDGFDDSTLPNMAPELSSYNPDPTTVAYGGGYAISGQSLPVVLNHMYAIASRKDTSDTPSSFYYDMFYVSALSDTSITIEARISK